MADRDLTRVVLADDHVVVRRGLRMLLARQDDIEVVAEVGSGDEALAVARDERPDVLVLDLNMPGRPSLEVLGEVGGDVAVLILTMEQDPEMARHALELGARGYLLKKSVEEDLLDAIREAAGGQIRVSAEIREAMNRGPDPGAADQRLTERELEVLKLVALGHTNPEISERLGISVRTVESHRMHIAQKVDVPTRPDLVRYALEQGLI